jgi:polysaccharide pyruvyl transferase CsaB
MSRVVLVGYQGMGNLGDEAIMSGIEELLTGSGVEVIAVATGGRGPIAAFPNAERVPTPRFLPGRAMRRVLRRADLMVFAGGGLLNDHWPTLIPRLLTWSLVARLLGARVGWLAAGVGPIRHRRSRWLARAVLGLASFVSVRDDASAALVRSMRGGEEPRVLPDPALFLPTPAPRSDARGLALIVRGLAPGGGDQRAVATVLAEWAAAERASGAEVTLVSLQAGEDERMIGQVNATIGSQGGAPLASRALSADPTTALADLAGFEAVISMRLHGVLLAALAGRPWVAIAYDPKVAAAAAGLGRPSLALAADGLTAAQLRAALAEARRPDAVAATAAALARTRGQRTAIQAWLNGVLA